MWSFAKATVIGFACLFPLASASVSFVKRTGVQQPPCAYPYTNFVYSGCYADAVYNRSLPFETKLEFNNATVQQCTAWCKGNNYRYAGLEYYGSCPVTPTLTICSSSVELISIQANASAAPASSAPKPRKQTAVFLAMVCPILLLSANTTPNYFFPTGDKSQACGGQDRISIYQDPTFPDADDIAVSADYKSLGCYTEGTSGRSLIYSQWDFLNPDAMTTELCLMTCGSKGYPFAGTEFGRECYCGVVLGNGTVPAEKEKCDSPCSGNATEVCGGQLHLSLYVAKNL
jgi:hypothetical protein